MQMRFDVPRFSISDLQNTKNIDEVREIFSSIPLTENTMCLYGDFHCEFLFGNHVTEAMHYLPGHVTRVVFEIQYYWYVEKGERISYVAVDGENIYESYSIHHREIGNSLKDYIASLPESVETLEVNFITSDDHLKHDSWGDDLYLFSGLPRTIKNLNLNFLPFWRHKEYAYSRLFREIPDTLQSMSVMLLYHDLAKVSLEQYLANLSAINRNLTELSISNSELYMLASKYFKPVISCFPLVKILRLPCNQFNKQDPDDLGLFLSLLPDLEKLDLSQNQLSMFGGKTAALILSRLQNVSALDIGENGFLMLPVEDFALVMESLSKRITWLRVCEKKTTQHMKEIAARLKYVNSNIRILSFSNGGLSGISLKEFTDIILAADLPDSVVGLDVSGNDLGRGSQDELTYLVSNLSKRFRFLNLSDNSLGCMKEEALQPFLEAVSPYIEELDVSKNGFEKLPNARMRNVMKFFPKTIKCLITGSEEFSLGNDGAMVPCNRLSGTGFFHQQKKFYYQDVFARFRIVMMQLMHAKGLNLDIIIHILSHVMNGHPALMKMRQSLSTELISSVPPLQITLAHQEECLALIEQRIEMARLSNDDCLDLSRCGLNRISNIKIMNEIESKIEDLSKLKSITQIKLRGNGFLYNGYSRNSYKIFIKIISEKAKNLDLSDNEFEYQTAEMLEEYFSFLDPLVELVRIDNEEPLSPALHIARRKWPESYFEITEGVDDVVEQGQRLLNIYTRNGSAFWRFAHGDWNHHHIEQVEKIVYLIDKKRITDRQDLKSGMEQIKLANKAGSLALVSTFLARPEPDRRTLPVIHEINEETDNLEQELPTIRIDGGHRRGY